MGVDSWVAKAWRRGIVTTEYPKHLPSSDEVPRTGANVVPAAPGAVLPTASDFCPTGAISGNRVDQGLCIRCARCLPAGLDFNGPVEAAVRRRADLTSGDPEPAIGEQSPALERLGHSLHVFMIDVGSCNACNLEVLALANPWYDLNRLGIFFTNSPRHADVLLVVGVPTAAMREPLLRTLEAIPKPRAVVAVGACPISGGIFRDTPTLTPGIDALTPVDVYIPGCPPAPIQILEGLLQLARRGKTGKRTPK